jgi:hypothetical protein
VLAPAFAAPPEICLTTRTTGSSAFSGITRNTVDYDKVNDLVHTQARDLNLDFFFFSNTNRLWDKHRQGQSSQQMRRIL